MLKLDPVQLCVKFVDRPMLPEEVIESSDVAMSDGVMTCFFFVFWGVSARLFAFSPADTRPRGSVFSRSPFQRSSNPDDGRAKPAEADGRGEEAQKRFAERVS